MQIMSANELIEQISKLQTGDTVEICYRDDVGDIQTKIAELREKKVHSHFSLVFRSIKEENDKEISLVNILSLKKLVSFYIETTQF